LLASGEILQLLNKNYSFHLEAEGVFVSVDKNKQKEIKISQSGKTNQTEQIL
jgi:hypothetical protein